MQFGSQLQSLMMNQPVIIQQPHHVTQVSQQQSQLHQQSQQQGQQAQVISVKTPGGQIVQVKISTRITFTNIRSIS